MLILLLTASMFISYIPYIYIKGHFITVLHAGRDFYDPYEGLAERGLYDLDEDILGLSYPGDCKCKILRKYAENMG
ncbi:hypothetical protein DPMN_028987 [Dreissena polymorpha]|uniref:Uncharacterized protein n=1 Tax=Dreissena polymorpha TaxID=45954 RepID=A0A9D4LVN4_DREPO|nr:hypothetical protein DPMN_028987 [Dreissena polymorpha]